MMTTKYWIGIACRDHVRLGTAGGFCQLGHGKAAPVRRLRPGDRIVYYSPREQMRDGDLVQAFTAIGRVEPGWPHPHDMGGGFVAHRRKADWFDASDALIQPLLPRMSFTRDHPNWGMVMRRGAFAIKQEDYDIIADAMGATQR